jgi:PAS domain S-box-containing protein
VSDTLPVFGGHPFDTHEGLRLLFLGGAGVAASLLSGRLRLATARADTTRRQFAEMFALNPAGSALVRVKDLVLVMANEAYLRTIGYTRAEAIGMSVQALGTLDPVDRARMMSEAGRGEAVEENEVTFCRKDGALRQGLMSMRPADRRRRSRAGRVDRHHGFAPHRSRAAHVGRAFPRTGGDHQRGVLDDGPE